MAPGGRAPVRVTTGGAPRSVNRSGMGNAETGPFHGCPSAPSHIAETKASEAWSVDVQSSLSSASLMAAGGEHVACELEQQEIEGRLEVAGEVRLDERGADGTEVVTEPDTDARLLACLGLRVGTRGRHGRSRHRSARNGKSAFEVASASTVQYEVGTKASISASRADESERHRLHAARRTAARQLAPQHRGAAVAHQVVQRPPRLPGLHEVHVNFARVRQRRAHRVRRDLVEGDAVHRQRPDRVPLLELARISHQGHGQRRPSGRAQAPARVARPRARSARCGPQP